MVTKEILDRVSLLSVDSFQQSLKFQFQSTSFEGEENLPA